MNKLIATVDKLLSIKVDNWAMKTISNVLLAVNLCVNYVLNFERCGI